MTFAPRQPVNWFQKRLSKKGHGRIETRIDAAARNMGWIKAAKRTPGQPRLTNGNMFVRVLNRTEYCGRCTTRGSLSDIRDE